MNLLIGGGSCVGKTVASQAIGLGLGLQHFELDSLLGDNDSEGFNFAEDPTAWDQDPAVLKERLVGKGHTVEPYLPRWLGQLSSPDSGLLLEGEGIDPSNCAALVDIPSIRFLFIVELDPERLRSTLENRSVSYRSLSSERQAAIVETYRLYNQWMALEAAKHDLPVVDSQPWSSLPLRLLKALQQP